VLLIDDLSFRLNDRFFGIARWFLAPPNPPSPFDRLRASGIEFIEFVEFVE
jgi:hypothetical protein